MRFEFLLLADGDDGIEVGAKAWKLLQDRLQMKLWRLESESFGDTADLIAARGI